MRVAVTLVPSGDLSATLAAARAADQEGLDAIGVWDHFHSSNPNESLIGGWSLYGVLAGATSRIRLVPMILNQLSYPITVLARESSTLAIASEGRFELGVGLGGWKGEHERWGVPFPGHAARVAMLEEKVLALKALWSSAGQPVITSGTYVRLDGAVIRPLPPSPPRVVVGGASHALLRRAVTWADELNVQGAELPFARQLIDGSGRAVALSTAIYVKDEDLTSLHDLLAQLEQQGVDRAFVNLFHPYHLVRRIPPGTVEPR